MIRSNQRDKEHLLKVVARAHGVSVSEVRAEMQATIEGAWNNPDPQKQAEFRKCFGGQPPTPEEFIYTMTKKLKY